MPTANEVLQELIRVLRFGSVGLGGFAVDAAILMLMVEKLHSGPFAGRAVSAPIAILFTFALNRHWSFATLKKPPIGSAFASYISVQGAGFLCNFAVYSAAMLVVPGPIDALVIASATAMIVNYLGARLWAFKG